MLFFDFLTSSQNVGVLGSMAVVGYPTEKIRDIEEINYDVTTTRCLSERNNRRVFNMNNLSAPEKYCTSEVKPTHSRYGAPQITISNRYISCICHQRQV